MNAKQFVGEVAKMKMEEEYPEHKAPPSEDWISNMNNLIMTAREIVWVANQKHSKKGKK